jgi:hypothetical protein
MDMQIDGISFTVDSEEELADLQEELRALWEAADAGELDLGPAARSLLLNAYFAAEARLAEAASV